MIRDRLNLETSNPSPFRARFAMGTSTISSSPISITAAAPQQA
jgi:hypothetical protein